MDLKPWNWDWNEESYPASSDFWVLVFFVPFFPLVRLILDRSIFEIVARRLISPTVNSKERRKTIVKFKESAWKCLCSSTVEALLLHVIYKEPWFKDTRRFLLGPGDQIWPDQKLKLQMKGTYMFVGGFNVYTIFALLFWETRRSDFKVMLVHHILTSFLILLSHIFGFSRIGSVILALHEIDDVLLEIAKMCKYSGAEAMASFSFILFFLSWTTLRLIYYPFWILWSISCKSIKVVELEWNKKHWIEVGPPHMILYYAFNILLYCLHVLNIYWWILICRVLIKQIRAKGKIDRDIRSDSEGEEDEHQD